MNVKMRFNTNYPAKSDKKWRILINDIQYLVDEIEINCASFTSKDIVIGDDGKEVEKFHISASPNNIVFDETDSLIKAIIK